MNPVGDLLLADRAHPAFVEDLHEFGRLVGIWDLDVQFFDEEGRGVFDGTGEWHFGWILDGRAIQDVLHYDTPDRYPAPPGERRIGTTLRYPDRTAGVWRVVFLGANSGTFLNLVGRCQDDETLLITGSDVDGSVLRWQRMEGRRRG